MLSHSDEAELRNSESKYLVRAVLCRGFVFCPPFFFRMSLFTPRHMHDDEGTIVNGYRVPTEEEMLAWQALHGPWAWWSIYGYYGLYFLCSLLGFFTLVHARNRIVYGLKYVLPTI